MTILDCQQLEDATSNLSEEDITICDCPNLTKIQATISMNALRVQNCPKLQSLPEKLDVIDCLLENLRSLESLPLDMQVSAGLVIRNCPILIEIPVDIFSFCTQLEIKGCPLLTALPELSDQVTEICVDEAQLPTAESVMSLPLVMVFQVTTENGAVLNRADYLDKKRLEERDFKGSSRSEGSLLAGM
jgi:hypothetical protein